MLTNCVNVTDGAKVILHKVVNPENFGVAQVKDKKIVKIKENQKNFFLT